jgi:WD40 repeat protein
MSSNPELNYEYQVGGSLRISAPSYIGRQADEELYQAMRAGEFCYVFNSRQMGKSSLRVQVKHRLEQDGVRCSAVDMTSIGSEAIAVAQWYRGLIAALWRGFNVGKPSDLQSWWQAQEDVPPVQSLQRFLEDMVLTQLPDVPVAILIDEIDSILSLPFGMDDFFALLRFCYNHRAEDGRYNRLTFALFGVATPSDLIQHHNRTPFNIGRPVELSGFTVLEAMPFAQGLRDYAQDPAVFVQAILDWTGGQPFLTQKLCQILVKHFSGEGQADSRPILPGEASLFVEQLVRDRIIEHWEQQDEPEHLRTIRDRLVYSEQNTGRLLGLYQRLLEGETILTDDSRTQIELLLSGLVVRHQGKLQAKCPIYQAVFNLDWVQQRLTDLRPYAQPLNVWFKYPEDTSRLLRGNALNEAKAWAQGKRLSDLDYKFLAASEALDRQEAQQALEAARTQEITARLAQQEKSNRQQKQFISALMISLFISIGLGIATFISYRWAIRSQKAATLSAVGALTKSAQALYDSEQRLNALIEAIHAKRHLEHLGNEAPQALAESVNSILQQAVYGTVERNQFAEKSELRGLAFSPKGNLIASSSLEGAVQLWRLDGQLLATFPKVKTDNGTFGLDFNPQGDRLAVAYGNGIVIIYNLKGQPLQTLSAHQGSTFSVAFSPDGQLLATAGADGTAKLWTLRGQLLKTFSGHTNEVWGVTFSPDGALLAAGSRDKTVRLWQVANGALLSTLTGYEGPVRALAYSPDGQMLATGSDDATVRLWHRDGTLLKAFTAHDAPIEAIAFAKNGEMFATASWDKTIRLWSREGKLLRTLQGHRDRVWALALSPDASTLASGSWDRTIRLWQIGKTVLTPLLGHTAAVLGVAVTPDGKTIATASDDQTVKLWNDSGKPLKTLYGHTGEVYTVTFSPDGQKLASSSIDRTIRIWDRSGKFLRALRGHQAEIWGVSFSPDGTLLASGSHDGNIKIWRVTDGKLLRTFSGKHGRIYTIHFSPEGSQLITANEDGTVQLWTIEGRFIRVFSGHVGTVNNVNFSPDGTVIVTGSSDKTIKLWRRSNGTLLRTLTGHQNAVSVVVFNKDGQLLASVSYDGTIKLWRLDGTLVSTLRGHQGRVWDVAFSPDGRKLISGSEDKTALLWDLQRVLNPKQVLADGCDWVRDYLKYNQALAPDDLTLCP